MGTTPRRLGLLAALAVPALLAGCGGGGTSTTTVVSTATAPAPPCPTTDPVLDDGSFVLVTAPAAGARVTSGFAVTGCSRTFEANVVWVLRDRQGRVLARGTAMGGSVDGPAPFSATVAFTVPSARIGSLEVTESDPSDGEGFPPVRHLIPLVLAP